MAANELPEDDEQADREPRVDDGCCHHGKADELDVRLVDEQEVVGHEDGRQKPAADQRQCAPGR